MTINFSQIRHAMQGKRYSIVQGECRNVPDDVPWRYEQFTPSAGHEFKDDEIVVFGSRGEFPICLKLVLEPVSVSTEDSNKNPDPTN